MSGRQRLWLRGLDVQQKFSNCLLKEEKKKKGVRTRAVSCFSWRKWPFIKKGRETNPAPSVVTFVSRQKSLTQVKLHKCFPPPPPPLCLLPPPSLCSSPFSPCLIILTTQHHMEDDSCTERQGRGAERQSVWCWTPWLQENAAKTASISLSLLYNFIFWQSQWSWKTQHLFPAYHFSSVLKSSTSVQFQSTTCKSWPSVVSTVPCHHGVVIGH